MARKQRVDTKDITDQRFGSLVALYIVPSKARGSRWKCKCDCGNECEALGGHLRTGARVSCGCKADKKVLETGTNIVFGLYKRKALMRKKEFNLSREEFVTLIFSNCYYCGRQASNELKRPKSKKTQIKYNGVDRFDTSKGYVSGNCVSCCWYCNKSKGDLSFDQWIDHLKLICSYQGIING